MGARPPTGQHAPRFPLTAGDPTLRRVLHAGSSQHVRQQMSRLSFREGVKASPPADEGLRCHNETQSKTKSEKTITDHKRPKPETGDSRQQQVKLYRRAYWMGGRKDIERQRATPWEQERRRKHSFTGKRQYRLQHEIPTGRHLAVEFTHEPTPSNH